MECTREVARGLWSSLCALVVMLSCSGCRVNKSDVTGKYMTGSNALAVDVKADGTFVAYKARLGGSGTWKINEHQLFDQGIELDGGGRQDGFSDEYHLVWRNGGLCMEARIDEEYWCKR